MGVRRRMVDLLGSISSPEKKAKASAIAPDTVGQGLPSVRIVQRAQRFRNQRKTRCNRSNCSSFSKPFLDQLSNGKKGNAYWPTIFRTYNVGDQLLVPTRLSRDNIKARGASRGATVLVKRSHASQSDHMPEQFNRRLVVAFGCQTRRGVPAMGRGLLLWLLGIPLPIILLIWLFGGLHG